MTCWRWCASSSSPSVSRSGLDRCLRRHGMGNLRDLTQPCPRPAHQPFQDYEPGFLHIDVTYLPQMPGESQRRSLFVAIDRATRWVFMQIKPTKSARSTRAFLTALVRACPLRIRTLLTVNGKEFTDRFVTCAEHTPTGQHALDALCAALSLEPCLTRPPPTPDQRDGRALQRSHQRGVARAALHQGGRICSVPCSATSGWITNSCRSQRSAVAQRWRR